MAVEFPVLSPTVASVDDFLPRVRALEAPRVLELGTLRSDASRSTRHQKLIPNAGEYIGTDFVAGPDVDVVADVHVLSEVVGPESFDIIVSFSTFEHIKYPHIAAHQIMKTLKVGGLLFIQTHQTFKLHAFPNDYFRFSTDALASMFSERMGFQVVATGYKFPAEIHSKEDGVQGSAFLNTHLYGEKLTATPDEYIYEFESAAGTRVARFSTEPNAEIT
jgi:hypothetical protein